MFLCLWTFSYIIPEAISEKLGHYSFFFVHTQEKKVVIPSGSGIKGCPCRHHSLKVQEKSPVSCAAGISENALLLETKVVVINYLPRNIKLA